MADESVDQVESEPESSRYPLGGTPTWARAVIFGSVALTLLVIGAIIGLLIGRSEARDTGTAPNPVDIGFSQDMSVHHLQAVTMGNWVRDHSEDPEVRQLGFDIASTQLGQVGEMEGWLTLWDQSLQAIGEYMTWMPAEHHGGHSGGDGPMPGMATGDELKKLRSLSGEKLDVYFLRLMSRHHQGGAPMAQYAAEHAAIPAVRRLAQSMVDSQGAELDTMRQMLAERGAKPLAF